MSMTTKADENDARTGTLIKCRHCGHIWQVRSEARHLTCGSCHRNNDRTDERVVERTVSMGGDH